MLLHSNCELAQVNKMKNKDNTLQNVLNLPYSDNLIIIGSIQLSSVYYENNEVPEVKHAGARTKTCQVNTFICRICYPSRTVQSLTLTPPELIPDQLFTQSFRNGKDETVRMFISGLVSEAQAHTKMKGVQ